MSQGLPSFAPLLAAAALFACSSSENNGTTVVDGGTGGDARAGTAGSAGARAGSGGTSAASGGTSGSAQNGVGGAAGAAPGAGGRGGSATGASGQGAAGISGLGGSGVAGLGSGGRGASGDAGASGASSGSAGTAGMGGASTGGAGAGGTAAGGSGGAATGLPFSFYMGADVTDQETQSESTRATLLATMQAHGFNSVRLRTFVDPKASDGYDKTNGYDDIAHTLPFAKQIKDAGMGFLLDFHYSDNWADPGKQCVPVAWQSLTTIAELATAVHDYTKAAISELVAGGARPDMVQVGNEITPGMLLHRCDSGGHPTGSNPVTGSIDSWTNLGTLLKAGVQGVKDVDPSILIALHIDRGDDLASSKSFITNAQNQGVKFDAFGESCYSAYQGPPSGWKSTFTALATQFPTLKLFIAEYGPEQKAANDMIYELANEQGLGTFNWEPTTQGDWNTGHDLLRRSGSTYTAQPDLALYDQMKLDYADRL